MDPNQKAAEKELVYESQIYEDDEFEDLQSCLECGKKVPKESLPMHQIRCRKRVAAKLEAGKLANVDKLGHNAMSKKKKQVPEFDLSNESEEKKEVKRNGKEEVFLNQSEILEPIICNYCGMVVNLCDFQSHHTACSGQVQDCQYCGEDYPINLMSQHHNNCPIRLEDMKQEKGRQEGVPDSQNMIQQLNMLLQLLMLARNKQPVGLQKQQIESLKMDTYKLVPGKTDLCTVCQFQFEKDEKIVLLECEHFFHNECIKHWLQGHSRCPNCNKNYSVPK